MIPINQPITNIDAFVKGMDTIIDKPARSAEELNEKLLHVIKPLPAFASRSPSPGGGLCKS